MEYRTSKSHPLQIARLLTPSGGDIGLTFCPGKSDPAAMTGAWRRDLNADLRAIRDWPAGRLVTLMETHELEQLRVPQLGEKAKAMSLDWAHLPIRDVSIPDREFEERWPSMAGQIEADLAAGVNVVIHCRGGLGRTGLVAGMLLVGMGVTPLEALERVRSVRSGAVETSEQERYLLGWCQRQA